EDVVVGAAPSTRRRCRGRGHARGYLHELDQHHAREHGTPTEERKPEMGGTGLRELGTLLWAPGWSPGERDRQDEVRRRILGPVDVDHDDAVIGRARALGSAHTDRPGVHGERRLAVAGRRIDEVHHARVDRAGARGRWLRALEDVEPG